MKKNYIVKAALAASLIVTAAACRDKTAPAVSVPHHDPVLDSSVVALTAPVNAQVVSHLETVQPRKGTRTYPVQLQGVVAYDTRKKTSLAARITGRIEKLYIKYNYQPVRKGQLILEVYAPELAAAQRELLMIAKEDNNNGLLSPARQRLQLLGMRAAEIDQVLRTGQILYRIPVYSNTDGYILEQAAATGRAASAPPPTASASGDGMGAMGGAVGSTPAPALTAPAATPVLLREGQYISTGQPLFTIYQANDLVAEFSMTPQQASKIMKGVALQFHPTSDASVTATGTIGLIEPVFRNGQNFSIARVYLSKSNYRPGQLLTANLSVAFEGGWWLPAEAVVQLGNKTIVFRKEGQVFTPVAIQPLASVHGMVQTSTDITGWEVAARATYLVDSESFIKTNQDAQQ